MSFPNKDRRKAIIYRSDGSTTVVQASAIRDTAELAYAISFLAHHRLYKMSKGGGVSVENAISVSDALHLAVEAFEEDVIAPLNGVDEEEEKISELGDGEVVNPFKFV